MKIFLDTNIVLRCTITQIPGHSRIRQAVDYLLANGNELWISGQVIREYGSVITRPQSFMSVMTAFDAAKQLRNIRDSFNVALETPDTIEGLCRLMDTHPMGGKQIHDANLVATMLDYKITHLFTLNTADFERFTPLITLMTLDQLTS
jgi:predicted nucleic acid-binding protein